MQTKDCTGDTLFLQNRRKNAGSAADGWHTPRNAARRGPQRGGRFTIRKAHDFLPRPATLLPASMFLFEALIR